MSAETTCPLALPLATYATYGGEIYDPSGEMIANTWCLPCRNPDVAEDERRQVANARAAEIVRRVNLHDELVEALRELRAAHSAVFPAGEEGQAAQTAWAERKVCADNAAFAVLAKVEAKP